MTSKSQHEPATSVYVGIKDPVQQMNSNSSDHKRGDQSPEVTAWQHFQAWFDDPATWHRPDDQKKTLPPQWRLQQSSWRYLNALLPWLGPPTNTIAQIWAPVTTVLLISIVIKLVDGHIEWKLDQSNIAFKLFRSSSFVLSLLLAFRLNRTYDRWWQARTAFGGIGGGLVNVVRQVATYTEDPILIRQYQKWGMCMVYGIVQLVNNNPKVTDPRVEQLLEPDELALFNSTTKPSKLCGTMLSAITADAGFGIDREIFICNMLGQVAACISQVARIKLQAMPFAGTLFCTGWMYIWLLVMPFGVFPEGSWWALLPITVMSTMLLGLEAVAVATEDPFKFFAYEAMIATTAKDMPRTVTEVQVCKKMIQGKYAKLRHTAAADSQEAIALPPWPQLAPRPQMA